MPESPSRLASADPNTQPGYAPISWMAVASLTVAVLFVVMLAWMGFAAFNKKQPLVEPPILFFPALAVVLAFIARRQIRAADGTRAGETYANAGWWLAVVAGLGYGAYLFAIDFAIRRDTDRVFLAWADHLKDLDAGNPKDPNLYAAAYQTLLPGVRTFSPKDIARMDESHHDAVAAFRQTDLVRLCERNPKEVEFRTLGLQDWQQKPTEITCTLSASVVTPEGEQGLIVPLRAMIDEKKARNWQILVTPGGYVKSRDLTRYGWMIDHLEKSGRGFAQELMSRLAQPGQAEVAYLAYVQPGQEPERALKMLSQVAAAAPARAAAAGTAIANLLPEPPDMRANLPRLFARPDGQPATAADLPRFLFVWTHPNRIIPAGTTLKANPEKYPVLRVVGDEIELRDPVELQLTDIATGGPTARGWLVLRVPAGADPQLLADLHAAHDAAKAGGAPRTGQPAAEVTTRDVPWRLVRIESDLRPARQAQPGMPDPAMMPGG
jgi:hypothetical protein